jgi:hypothetical protein
VGGTDRRKVLGRLMQVAPVLALVAIAGFALGACGGGGSGGGAALSTQTGLTRTTPDVGDDHRDGHDVGDDDRSVGDPAGHHERRVLL